MTGRRRTLTLVSAGVVLFWVAFFLLAYHTRGLFNFLGVDFGVFWAAANVLWWEGAPRIPDINALTAYNRQLTAYYAPGIDGVAVGPAPYPPVFFAALLPLLLVPPPLAFLAWTLLNLALAVELLRRLARRFPPAARGLVVLALLGSYFPLEQTLFVGQVTVLLAWAVYGGYVALERGYDLRGGLWLGLLLLKPQYALGLVLALLLKRRWRALAGMGLTGVALAVPSLALLGLDGALGYARFLSQYGGFREVAYAVFPSGMVSWRGLLVDLLPGASETLGLTLTTLLSVGTLALLPLVWRGPWDPGDGRFAARMLATLLITMLAAFHNHLSGAVLLIPPALLLVATGIGGPSGRALASLLLAGLVAPPLVYLLSGGDIPLVAHLFTILMALTLGALLVQPRPVESRA